MIGIKEILECCRENFFDGNRCPWCYELTTCTEYKNKGDKKVNDQEKLILMSQQLNEALEREESLKKEVSALKSCVKILESDTLLLLEENKRLREELSPLTMMKNMLHSGCPFKK